MAGNYALAQINGQALPYVILGPSAPSPFTLEVVGGSLTLRSDMTYVAELVEQSTTKSTGEIAETTYVSDGTYSVLAGGKIRMDGPGLSSTATLDGATLEYEHNAKVFRYSKQ